jgi:hypothetical protein
MCSPWQAAIARHTTSSSRGQLSPVAYQQQNIAVNAITYEYDYNSMHHGSNSTANRNYTSSISKHIAYPTEQITKRGVVPTTVNRDLAVSMNVSRKSKGSKLSVSSVSGVSYIQSPPRLNGRRSRITRPYNNNSAVHDEYSGTTHRVQHDRYR